MTSLTSSAPARNPAGHPGFDPTIDAGTGLLNPHGLRDHASQLADAVGDVLDDAIMPAVDDHLHLDVDMGDFLDLLVADLPRHNAGPTFDEAMRCLTIVAGHEGLGPHHHRVPSRPRRRDGSTPTPWSAGWLARSPGDAPKSQPQSHA